MTNGEFQQRLGEIARGYKSVNGFSRLCGVSNSLMLSYLRGGALPGLNNLVKIASASQVNLLWLATGEGPKTAPPPDGALGLCLEEAKDRLAQIDQALEKASAQAGARGLPGPAAAQIRIYAFLCGFDEKQTMDLAKKWSMRRGEPRRVELKLLQSAIRLVEELAGRESLRLSAEKRANVIALLYEQALGLGSEGAQVVDREFAKRLLDLAR